MSRRPKSVLFKRLAGLPEQRPKTKAGQVRWLWPEIKAALEAGHTVREIWEALADDGIKIAYGKLRLYVARLRKAGREIRPVMSSEMTAGSQGLVGREDRHQHKQSSGESGDPDDPLANVKDREAKRPTFDYRPGLDEEKLF